MALTLQPLTANLYQIVRQCCRSFFAVWMALLLLFGTTTKDWLHEFANHVDTADCHRPVQGLILEKEHHHCSFLTDMLLPFAAPAALQMPQPFEEKVFVLQPVLLESADGRLPVSTISRGPPVSCYILA